MPLRAIIFDFDGVILDTEMYVYESWRDQHAAEGLELPLDDWVRVLGMPAHARDFHAELEAKIGRPLDREQLRRKRRAYIDAKLAGQPALPGVTDYVRHATERRIRLAVASGSTHDWVDTHLRQLGLFESFQSIVCAEDTTTHKPGPEPFLEAARRLNVPPEACVAIEDSLNGIRAANAAGMFTLAVPTAMTRNEDFAIADLVVPSLAALPFDDLLHHFA